MKVLADTLRSVQLWLTIAALVLAPLFFGSVDPFWVVAWTIVLSTSALCGLTMPVGNGQKWILSTFLAGCCAYVLVAVVQIVPNMIGSLPDPIWQRANDLLGLGVPSRISSRAEIPPAAIGHFLLFVTSFLCGMFVGTSRTNGDVLMRFARYSILVYALYGMAALALTPNMVLWAPKTAYHRYLTGTFINHNTAATYFGAGSILWFCWAYLLLQSLNFSSIRLLLLMPSNERVAFKLMLRSAAGLTCFFALLLTGSRGGLICTCLGLLVAIGLMMSGKLKAGAWYVLGSGAVALALLAVWLSGIGRIGSHGLFDSGRWAVYEACLELVRQRPLLGSGAGTFADLFPALRPNNISMWGVWDFAHSTILEIAVEMGVPIAAAIVAAAFASVFILGRGALKSRDRERSVLAAIAGIAVLSYLHATIDFSLQIPGYLIVFGIILGCGAARASSNREAGETRSRTRGSVRIAAA